MLTISLRTYFAGALFMVMVLMLGCSPAAQTPTNPGSPSGTSIGTDEVNTKAPFLTKGEPKYGGILRRAQIDDPPNFDLYSNSTNAMQNVTWPAYNNLLIFDPYNFSKIIPDLAEKWEVSPDGKQVTFHLRQAVKFSNGTPMTAKDVKFSFDWMRSPPSGLVSTRQGGLEPIDRIDIVDDFTVRITLNRPYAGFLPTLAQGWMAIYSKDYAESKGHDIYKKEMMGTGAFKLKEYVRGTSVTLEKNPNYWQSGVPYLDGVQMFMIPDPGTRFAAFRTGQVDLFGLNADQENQIRTTLGDKINIQNQDSISWQTLNMNAKRKPFDNMQVRQAISYAIDRPGFIKAIQGGLGRAGGYVPPTSQYALPPEELAKLPGYGPDAAANKAQAKKLLTDAGFPTGFETTFTVRKGQEDLAVYLTDQLKQVGIATAPMKILDSGPAYDAAVKLDFDMLPWGHGLALDDPDAHYSELYVCGAFRDYSGLCDMKVNELYIKQSQELDPAKRKPLVWDMEKYAIPLQIKIILSWGKAQLGTWSYVKGYVQDPSAGGYNVNHYKQIWMDK